MLVRSTRTRRNTASRQFEKHGDFSKILMGLIALDVGGVFLMWPEATDQKGEAWSRVVTSVMSILGGCWRSKRRISSSSSLIESIGILRGSSCGGAAHLIVIQSGCGVAVEGIGDGRNAVADQTCLLDQNGQGRKANIGDVRSAGKKLIARC